MTIILLSQSNLRIPEIVALGQVMTRLQVGWFFLPNRSYQHPKDAFRISIGLTMFWITINCLVFYLPPPGLSLTTIISLAVVNAIIYIYYISNVIRVRLRLRHAYLIPNNFRDVLIGGLLAPVAVMQMLRHTCDYSTYVGKLLTPVRFNNVSKLFWLNIRLTFLFLSDGFT